MTSILINKIIRKAYSHNPARVAAEYLFIAGIREEDMMKHRESITVSDPQRVAVMNELRNKERNDHNP